MCWNRNIINNVIDCLNNSVAYFVRAERCFFLPSTGYYKLKSYQNINIFALCVSARVVAESSPSEPSLVRSRVRTRPYDPAQRCFDLVCFMINRTARSWSMRRLDFRLFCWWNVWMWWETRFHSHNEPHWANATPLIAAVTVERCFVIYPNKCQKYLNTSYGKSCREARSRAV